MSSSQKHPDEIPSPFNQDCVLQRAINLVCDATAVAIINTLIDGPAGARTIASTDRTLSEHEVAARLQSMEESGLVCRAIGTNSSKSFALTAHGKELIEKLRKLEAIGALGLNTER